MAKHPSIPFVVPFVLFMAFLVLDGSWGIPETYHLLLRVVVVGGAILYFSRHLLSFQFTRPALSVAVGILVFAMWIAPDYLFPGYRNHWLFQNAITGTLKVSLSAEALRDPAALALRSLRAVLIVPIVEELFWRGWLMRWLISPDFEKVAPGAYGRQAFWLTALLFASVHGPYWDVGLACGAIYNGWMVRTKNWNDLILTHAVTNGCLCAFVIITGRWEYWM
ncbi:MAG: CAAX prenyl protease-related protein [Bryobacterales bacterium]|nr:CAAX prenyl protease-related protein [Bryobacterales bacterium]